MERSQEKTRNKPRPWYVSVSVSHIVCSVTSGDGHSE